MVRFVESVADGIAIAIIIMVTAAAIRWLVMITVLVLLCVHTYIYHTDMDTISKLVYGCLLFCHCFATEGG